LSPLTRIALSNPTAVAVAVILAIMFGVISLGRLPIQMIPEVERPQISVSTAWRAAAPEEVEAEIIEPQEEAFRGIPGLVIMESSAGQGNGSISLTFAVGTDIRRALIEVMNRLNRVPNYPPDALQPIVSAGGGSFGNWIAWFVLTTRDDNPRSIETYQEYVEEVIQARFERVPGVSTSESFGARAREVRVTFDPYLAASYGIDLPQVITLLGGNSDTSAGFQDVGRRAYTVRYAGGYTADELNDMIVTWREGNPIYLRDVAEVEIRMVDRRGVFYHDGVQSIAINATPETGVNVLEVMDGLREAMTELQDGPLDRAGLDIKQVYDETDYINDSISMVRNNLLLGILLAVAVLWWFLRRFRATVMVALAIPVSLLLTFTLLDATGRTLNIISLAGLAFAVGMTLDAAIVMLENIVRLREQGEEPKAAALTGAGQVWGALLASTATTVAIFLPVVFLEDVAGQLFADLALTIAVAVVASLLIAISVIPTATAKFLVKTSMRDPHAQWWTDGTAFLMRLTNGRKRRLGWIAGLLTVPILLAALLLPRADYLPTGNQNFIFAFILPPPGASAQLLQDEFADVINERMRPHLEGDDPLVGQYFFGMFGRNGFLGTEAADPGRVNELLGVLNGQILAGFPDTIAFASRASVFGRVAGGRSIDINIQGGDIEALLAAASAGFGATMQALPGASARPIPSLDLAEPELRLIPDERRIAEAGWTRRTVASLVRSFGAGLYLGDYFDGDQRLDIILRAVPWDSPQDLAAYPVYTPGSGIQPLGELVRIERTAGPDQIRRVDRRRTITLRVSPPQALSLEETIDALEQHVAPAIEAELPEDGAISYRGTADDLRTALRSMGGSFALAIVILYLLISALFQSFRDSLLVIVAIPLATVGGVLALRVVNLITFQPMDLLTMIGFIVLLGLVVNNAILLVYQTRAAEREGLDRRAAVENAIRLRLRPILMSTLTSLFGMMPLLLLPGAGTEVYRGMAAVIVGGMAVSTLFTLVLLPALLRLGEERQFPEPRSA
jgi:multidrug efflux pump subunit AcrB